MKELEEAFLGWGFQGGMMIKQLAFFSLSICLIAQPLWARENQPVTEFPVRTLLYSLELQNQGISSDQIKQVMLDQANALKGTTFNSYPDLEALPVSKQMALVIRLEAGDIEKSFKSDSLFHQKPMPLEVWAKTMVADKIQPTEAAAKAEIVRYYNRLTEGKPNVATFKSFDELKTAMSYDQQLTFAQNFGPEGNAVAVERASMSPQEFLQLFKKRIEVRLKGQPEAAAVVLQIEKQIMFYGYNRETPEVFVMMGMPGSGKDTLVRALVDAIHGYVGAYKDHMFETPILHTPSDLWHLLGSATGFVGSSNLSPLIRWLVDHSGGRYKIVYSKEGPYVVENSNWKPGIVLTGYTAPEDSVLFINEFHNWSKAVTDLFLKQVLDKGFFSINNPGQGVDKLYVPVNIAIATNSGINLLASRELNGERHGPPLTHEQMLNRWVTVYNDDAALKNELSRVNGLANSAIQSENAPGISEEMLDRLKNKILFRPNSPQVMREIIIAKLRALQDKINLNENYKSVRLVPTAELVDFLVDYEFSAESGGRAFNNKIESLIEKPLVDSLFEGKLPIGKVEDMTIGIEKNTDKTYSLAVTNEADKTTLLPISYTEKEKDREPLSAEAITQLQTLPQRIAQRVVGVKSVAGYISKRILVSEDARRERVTPDTATAPAQTYMFLGPSSTGKNELAKTLAQEVFGDSSAYVLLDFSRVQTKRDLEELILGTRDINGNGMPSPFMKDFDRLQGRAIFVFDEVANAPKEVLKALYDILREPVVRTFSDNKPRVMSNAIIIMTGNAGEEWYTNIPRDIPEVEQQEAMDAIYHEAMKDPDFVRKFLEERFSPALLNRIGVNNIFFFPGLNFQSVRALSQIKLMGSLKRISAPGSRNYWNVEFASPQDFSQLVDSIDNEGFVLWEQGASIDRFVNINFEQELRHLLMTSQVASGSTVVISKSDSDSEKAALFTVTTETGKEISFPIAKRGRKPSPKTSDVDKILTAYHEAGHEIVRHVLFGDKLESDLISIVPGVTQINNRWIRYLGIAKYNMNETWMQTREAVIYQMAQLAAGEVAQTLVTKGSRHDAGKSNDMERASQLATLAILKWGLSEKWGRASVPAGMDLQAYIDSLSQERKELFESELKEMMSESRNLARGVLIANFKTLLIPMATALAEKGTLKSAELESLYSSEHEILANDPRIDQLVAEFDKSHIELQAKSRTRDAQLLDEIPKPEKVADIDELREKIRQEARNQVPLPSNIPLAKKQSLPQPELKSVLTGATMPAANRNVCQELFAK